MSHPGFKVMLNLLFGNPTNVDLDKEFSSRVISDISLNDETLRIVFDNARVVHIYDDGQSCCEHRYMRTDDALSDFVGSTFVGAEIRDSPDQSDDWGVHEVQFLVIKTDRGHITFSNHNEHNGYYGGFSLAAVEQRQKEEK